MNMNMNTHVEIVHRTGYPMAYGEYSPRSDIFEAIAGLQSYACKRHRMTICELVSNSEFRFRFVAA